MTVTVRGKWRTTWFGCPLVLEWQLPIESVKDAEVFEKIAEEMRRIARTLKVQEERKMRRMRNEQLRNLALQNLKWLFETEIKNRKVEA